MAPWRKIDASNRLLLTQSRSSKASVVQVSNPAGALSFMKPIIRVVNRNGYHKLSRPAELTVMIDRTTPLGNPFRLKDKNDSHERDKVIEQFDAFLTNILSDSTTTNYVREAFYELLEKVKKVNTVDLICHCSPLPCHGDVIKRKLEELL